MFKAETKADLTKLGFDVEKMVAAATHADEQDFALPELLTKADVEERDKNTGTGKFKEGKEAGIEIANKAIAKKFGFDLTKTSDIDELINHLNGKIANGDTTLQEQIKLLQSDKKKLETEKTELATSKKTLEFDTELLTAFPANRTADLSDRERLVLLKSNLEFTEEDGVRVVKRDGKILRNEQTQSPIATKDAIKTYFDERKWIGGEQGGRGGGDNQNNGGATGIKTQSAAQKAFMEANPTGNLASPQYHAYVAKVAKETTDFDWHK